MGIFGRVRPHRLALLLLVLAALCLPSSALAQEEPHGGDNPPALQGSPPVMQDDPDGDPAPAPRGQQLPATGGETGLIALVGAGMVMMGFGLRLRLPGA